MTQDIVIRARIDQATKLEATAILASVGMTLSEAFRLMTRRIVADKGLPFEPFRPNAETIEAMMAARRGEFDGTYNTVEELMADLNAPD